MIRKQKMSTIPTRLESVSSTSSVENDELIALISKKYESKQEFIEEFEKFCKYINKFYNNFEQLQIKYHFALIYMYCYRL